jgi:hypothetical protein
LPGYIGNGVRYLLVFDVLHGDADVSVECERSGLKPHTDITSLIMFYIVFEFSQWWLHSPLFHAVLLLGSFFDLQDEGDVIF